MALNEYVISIPKEHISNIFGEFDHNIKQIEKTLGVSLIARDGELKILGESAAADKAVRVIEQLVNLARNGNVINDQNVNYALSLVFDDKEQALTEIDHDLIGFTLAGKPIKPKTIGQK